MNIVEQQKIGGYVLLTLQGEICHSDVGALASGIKNLIKYKRNIIIDFEACERIHSSAIAFLLNINQKLNKHKLQLYLCHPPYDFQFVLQMLGLEHHIQIIAELDDLLEEQDFKDATPLDHAPIDQHPDENPTRPEDVSQNHLAVSQAWDDLLKEDG